MKTIDKQTQSENICKFLGGYQKLDLPVIPCIGKRPLISGWTRRTTPTDAEIEEWPQAWPGMNIGLILGAAPGIVGIDVDGPQAWERLQEISKGDLPKTWSFKTPGSDEGRRLLYRLPRGVTKAVKWSEKLAGEHSELALLGDGQQTILPPSVHPNGKPYEWLEGQSPEDLELAEAPQWLLARMKASAGKAAKAKPEKPPAEAEAVFERMSRCQKFTESLVKQKAEGLTEEDWFSWVRLLVSAGQSEAALAFSRLSSKHDKRSEERIQSLSEETGADGGPMIRCTTFGCSEENIAGCFVTVNKNDKGDITNSPGAFIKNMDRPLPPTDPAYLPYSKATEENRDYGTDERGNMITFDHKGNPRRIANFVARPTLEVIRDDGVSKERTFRIEGVLTGGKPLAPVDVSAAEFKRMGWVTEAWGIGPSIRPGLGTQDLCRDAIQHMGIDVEQHYIYTHMGWRRLPDGQWCFLHAGGAIGAENIAVELERALAKYRLARNVEDLKRAAQASLRLLMVAPLDVTIPLLALVYLSVLCEALRGAGIEPSFLLWLYGGTGTRKTSLALLFLLHFGDFGMKSPPASFKDTANALEKKAFAAKDTLLLIDDYHPEASSYEAQKMAQTAQRVLRMFGDRIGRGRLTASIQFQKDYPPRGMALVTGEDLPSGESSVARFLGIELSQGAVDLKALTQSQQEGPYLQEAMRGYIEWLIPQMDVLPDKLHAQFLEKRIEFQEKATHGRSGEAAAWLSIGFGMMLKYMQFAEACNSEVVTTLSTDAEQVFSHLISSQNELITQEQPVEIFIEVLKELFASSKVRLTRLTPGGDEAPYGTSIGELLGWYDDQFLYLLPEQAYNVVNQFLAKRSQRLPVTIKILWRQLEKEKMICIEKGSDGKVQRCPKRTIPTPGRKKDNEYRPRLLHLYKNAFQSYEKSA
jgi:hypothetical protein